MSTRTKPDEIDTSVRLPTPGAPPVVGLIDDEKNRIYRGLDPRLLNPTPPPAPPNPMPSVIYQASLLEEDFNPSRITPPRFDRYGEMPSQGTSMAAPHVAGLAALLYRQGTTLPAAVEGAPKGFARDLGARGRDDEFGYGLVDAPATLRGRGHGVARGRAQAGHHDRRGLGEGVNSWNSVHASRGCDTSELRATRGAGLFDCFGID